MRVSKSRLCLSFTLQLSSVQRVDDRLGMSLVLAAGIDDGDVAATDDIGAGAGEGHAVGGLQCKLMDVADECIRSAWRKVRGGEGSGAAQGE